MLCSCLSGCWTSPLLLWPSCKDVLHHGTALHRVELAVKRQVLLV
jgi:hypothetical protein